MAALNVGVKGVGEVFEHFGPDAVSDGMDRFLDYCEGRVRRNIDRLREGTYTSVDYLDDDGFREEPVAIQCTATVADGGIVLDFAGTAAPDGQRKERTFCRNDVGGVLHRKDASGPRASRHIRHLSGGGDSCPEGMPG